MQVNAYIQTNRLSDDSLVYTVVLADNGHTNVIRLEASTQAVAQELVNFVKQDYRFINVKQ